MGPLHRQRARRPWVTFGARFVLLTVSLVAGCFALLLSSLAASAATRPAGRATASPPGFRQSFGQKMLDDPDGVALDPDGNIWVADTGHNRIEEFAPSGRLVTSFGLAATSGGGLDQPQGIAVDVGGHIWVADTGHNRVIEFSTAGRVLTVLGRTGPGRGELNAPVAVAIGPFGDVWVADQGNNRVEEFTAFGRYRTAIAVRSPAGVAIDLRGGIWVSSASYAAGNKIEEFTAHGRLLASFGTNQAAQGDLGNPGGIAIGPAGRIYVTQPDYDLVSVFTPAGRLYTEFGLPSDTRKASEKLDFPESVAVTTKDQVWIADSGNNRIAEFGSVPGSAAPAAPAVPGGLSVLTIVGECLLAVILAGLGWYLAHRRGSADNPPTPAR